MNTLLKDYYTSLHIDERVFDYCQKIEYSLKDRFAAIDAIPDRKPVFGFQPDEGHQSHAG